MFLSQGSETANDGSWLRIATKANDERIEVLGFVNG